MIYDSGSAPRRVMFSPRETIPVQGVLAVRERDCQQDVLIHTKLVRSAFACRNSSTFSRRSMKTKRPNCWTLRRSCWSKHPSKPIMWADLRRVFLRCASETASEMYSDSERVICTPHVLAGTTDVRHLSFSRFLSISLSLCFSLFDLSRRTSHVSGHNPPARCTRTASA